ncbi:MAG: hypothetical protein FD165_1995 [Gammaproteobacteria bacterium]|nr:MAG: hypothetical protein FD165_1995 [Gammaproteobacteria bacterium]TND04987.1 MAG: hypothetical protein FD120_1265 [Gammaproteobacteria bacterium]
MKVHWHGEARAEADAAAAFYHDQQQGLAQRFIDELEEVLHRIQRHPCPTARSRAEYAGVG